MKTRDESPGELRLFFNVLRIPPDHSRYWNLWAREVTGQELTPETPVAEIFVSQLPDDGDIQVWRITSLHVPRPWRRAGVGRKLVLSALYHIDRTAAPGIVHVYLEAVPYEHDESPETIPVEVLRAFYTSAGFERVPGHPFAMRQELRRKAGN